MLLLIIIFFILLILYFYNRFTLRENFYSKTGNIRGKARRFTRNVKKTGNNFMGHIVHKIKLILRKLNS
jgi:hypothetical protein